VRPRLAGIVEGDEAEDDAQSHQGEGGREPHHDHDHDQGQHQQAECGIAHILLSPPMPRCRAASSMCCTLAMASLRDSSSTYWLSASCSSTTSISPTSWRRDGQAPVLRQATQRTTSAMPCRKTRAPATGITVLKW